MVEQKQSTTGPNLISKIEALRTAVDAKAIVSEVQQVKILELLESIHVTLAGKVGGSNEQYELTFKKQEEVAVCHCTQASLADLEDRLEKKLQMKCEEVEERLIKKLEQDIEIKVKEKLDKEMELQAIKLEEEVEKRISEVIKTNELKALEPKVSFKTLQSYHLRSKKVEKSLLD